MRRELFISFLFLTQILTWTFANASQKLDDYQTFVVKNVTCIASSNGTTYNPLTLANIKKVGDNFSFYINHFPEGCSYKENGNKNAIVCTELVKGIDWVEESKPCIFGDLLKYELSIKTL